MGGHAYTVLVVDDDASIRLLCRVNLELEGYVVLEAETLADARRQLAELDVDAVLLDVHLGPESGYELLGEIYGRTPVALLTGSADKRETVGKAANARIAKPFTLDELTSTVRRLIEGDVEAQLRSTT
jgi:two-component system, OmpR family, KDP operon response regulator KdpE